jgi:hypothetical protein
VRRSTSDADDGRRVFAMKRLLFIVLVVLGGSVGLLILALRRPAGPRIHIDRPVIHVGQIDEQSKPRQFRFRITNQGNARLEIPRVLAGCPCLNVKLACASLLPGEEAFLTGEIPFSRRPGDLNERILVYSNDPDSPVTQLSVRAYVTLKCMAVPDAIVVNALKRNEPRETVVDVFGPSNDSTFRVTGASTHGNAIETLRISELALMPETGRRRWRVELRIGATSADTWEDVIAIATTNTRTPVLEVPVTVNQVPAFRVIPRIVSLALDPGVKQAGAHVDIVPTGKITSLRIAQITNPDWVMVTSDSVADRNVHLRITLSEEDHCESKDRQGTITVVLDDEHRSTLSIPVLLFVRE